MRRDTLSIDYLGPWAQLNGVDLNGVCASPLPGSRGSGLLATSEIFADEAVLMVIPQALVLSLENVWIYAKSDKHLQQVLEAVGDYSRTARGAVLIFLLLQLTNSASNGKIGVKNPFSEYVKLLPQKIALPTFWDEDELSTLTGTSLETAVDSKLKRLDREFTVLYNSTATIDWCRYHWWDTETGNLALDDWKMVDAMYRSRALDLPGTGDAMVPCIDMANHASDENTVAWYDTDNDGNAVLVLQEVKKLYPGDEVTITYGDGKGASEMLFSYGFIEATTASAKELFLDLQVPDDDPLKMAKNAVSKTAHGFRLYELDGSVAWESSFIWLVVVNEEDGLGLKLLQNLDGDRELEVSWKNQTITEMQKLQALIESDPLREVFNLRVIAMLQDRVEKQLLRLGGSKARAEGLLKSGTVDANIRQNVEKVRDLEETLLLHAYDEFEIQKLRLITSPVVQEYLASSADQSAEATSEDFS